MLVVIPLVVVIIAGAGWFFFLREKPIVYTEYAPGEHFVTNLKNSRRLLKAAFVFKLDTTNGKTIDTVFKANQPFIRETIIFILRDLDETTVETPGFHVELTERIRETLNEVLNTKHIVEVHLNDFVLQ